MNRQEMVNIRFKLVKFSQHVLNDDDISGRVNEFLEKCKCIPFMVPFATCIK